jgi:uncharacterized protein YraI
MELDEARPETIDLKDPEAVLADVVTTSSLGARYPVAPGYRVNVRSGPGTGHRLVRVLPVNSRIPINCQKQGEWVTGPYGTTNIWDCIDNGEWVSDAYVRTGSDGFVTSPCS